MRSNFRIYAALSRKKFESEEKKVNSSRDNPISAEQKHRNDEWIMQIADNESSKKVEGEIVSRLV